MTSIGRRCRGGNVYSRAILITQTLSGAQAPASESPKGETKKHRSRQGRPSDRHGSEKPPHVLDVIQEAFAFDRPLQRCGAVTFR